MPKIDSRTNRDPSPRRRGRPPFSESDLGAVDKTPKGTGNVGAVTRSIRMTPLGWAHVSAEVRERLGRPSTEVTT